MKVEFNRVELADALGAVSSVAATRTPKDILKCVRLEVGSDVLLLSATDLELSVRYAVTHVDVGSKGECVVMADTLSRIIRECHDEVMSLETKENMLHVRGSGSHFQVVTHDDDEFPPVPAIEGDPDFTIEAGDLRRLIEWTIFACARESTRYAINGVLWECDGPKLTLAATDGRRLATGQNAIQTDKADLKIYAIVPSKAMNLISRIPTEDDAIAEVKLAGSQLLLRLGPVTMSSSLVEGQFPRYQDVIPADNDKKVELDKSEFSSALRRAALLTNEESKGVRLSFSTDGLKLTSRAPEQGEAEINMPVEYSAETIELGFNPVFLLDVLKVTHSDKIQFTFKEPNRPGLFKTDRNFLYVVMPVSLS